jgi:hypothetical protein
MIFSYAHLSVYQPCSCDMKIILSRLQNSVEKCKCVKKEPATAKPKQQEPITQGHGSYYIGMDNDTYRGGMIGSVNQDMGDFPERNIIENYYEEKYSTQGTVENLFLLKRIFNSHKNPIVTIYKTQV